MNNNWLKPNIYAVQNGKLVPRSTTPKQNKNYRYIHFDSYNNPTPEDYFRETIYRLQKENNTLRGELTSKIEEEQSRMKFYAPITQSEQSRQYQVQIQALLQQLDHRQREISQKNQLLMYKDKQILELSNENSKLHLRINNVVKQIDFLNFVMSKKDQQLLNKKQQVQQYSRAFERLTLKQKEQQKTMFSQNYITTPRIQQQEQEQDEFFSIQCNSMDDRLSLKARFMTPEVQSFRLDGHNSQIHRTQGNLNTQQHNFKSATNIRQYSEEDKKSNYRNQLNDNLNNVSFLGNKNNRLSLDLLEQQVDPLVGSFSSHK